MRSWVYRTLDWFLLHVPVVATIYRAVRNVVESLGSQFQGGADFKRVVLVEFPHPGMRSLGLVTNSLQDVTTGRTILTVCVMTGLMPPAGFTLFVPEESVTNIAWNVNETLQAIISGGITAPTRPLLSRLQRIAGFPAAARSSMRRGADAAIDAQRSAAIPK